MARWLIGFVLFSTSGFSAALWADSSIIALLSDEENLTPQALFLQVERDYPGTICDFGIDIENGELIYELSIIDPSAETITEFEFKAKDGRLVKQQVEALEGNDFDELVAVNLMNGKSISFSTLVEKAMVNKQAFILEAQLDHDLGISYLELKLIDVNGKSKIAFDIQSLRPLPLLKWN